MTITTFGRVTSGRGIASKQGFFKDPALISLLGAEPFPGTLNLLLNEPIDLPVSEALVLNGGRSWFWLATFEGRRCLAHRWTKCPLHVVEIISDVKLRDHLGDRHLQVEVTLPSAGRLSFIRRISWSFLWRGYEEQYYKNDKYLKKTKRWWVIRHLANQTRSKK